MKDFRKLVFISMIAGIIAAMPLSVLQYYFISPLINAAEQLEISLPEQHHDWQPEKGFQRNILTLFFNSALGFAFALLLASGMYIKNHRDYIHGLIWGIAGYSIFFIAPALGLPPELPGTEHAALSYRQIWWWLIVILTTLGLLNLCFGKNRAWQMGGFFLLLTPHYFINAPHVNSSDPLIPEILQQSFILSSAVSNGFFWLTLGLISGSLLSQTQFEYD